MPFRYFIGLSFDGTHYHGWQLQKNAKTIQQELEEALAAFFEVPVAATGAGRTDTGVHAREFYAHIDVSSDLNPDQLERLTDFLSRNTSPDIAIHRIVPVQFDLHARFSATSRTYQYHITRVKDPFLIRYAWYLYGHLDIALMNQGAEILMTCDDFTSFAKHHTQVKTNICRITEAYWKEEGEQLIFTITANRFLRGMVRAIVGTLVELGQGKMTLEDFRRIIEQKDRSAAGFSVPAKGLFLTSIQYPEAG